MTSAQMIDRSSSQRRGAAPPWWLVFTRELAELWVWGKALVLIILFSVLLGIMAFLLAANSELDLMPPKEMIFLTLQASLAVGLFIGLIIGADSISGERERATLESLLLTPTGRGQIVAGKFLAAVSPWPAALVITVPYLAVLSQGDAVWIRAVLWGAALGTLLVPAFTGFGMLVSIFCNSNKTSMFVSLTVYLLCLLPTQFPGGAQKGAIGQLLKKVNPMESTNHFLEKMLVNNRTLDEMAIWLLAPVLFLVVVLGLLVAVCGRGLQLEAGRVAFSSLFSRTAAMFAAICTAVSLGTPALASEGMATGEARITQPALAIDIDMGFAAVKTGDRIEFQTRIRHLGEDAASPPMIVAMNIVNLEGAGDPVDPEDWSPERTQYVEALPPGAAANLAWAVTPIMEGNYMVYMVLIPEPDGPGATSQPVATSGIHLTVSPFTKLNPGGVLPIAIAVPILLVLGMLLLLWNRRRRIDAAPSY
jgi:ABC-2 type transport system permease protein